MADCEKNLDPIRSGARRNCSEVVSVRANTIKDYLSTSNPAPVNGKIKLKDSRLCGCAVSFGEGLVWAYCSKH